MTREVMAALTDPACKNKMQMISKICDGGPKHKPPTLTKEEVVKDSGEILLAQYLAHNRRINSKPKSQGVNNRRGRIAAAKQRGVLRNFKSMISDTIRQNTDSPNRLM